MKTATFTDFRQNLKQHLEELQGNQDFLVLTGPKKKDFVVLTLETFNAMEETSHLLSTSVNTKRLLESIAQDKAGNVTVGELNPDGTSPAAKRKRKIVPSKRSK